MTNDIVIQVRNVNKRFLLPHEKKSSIKTIFTSFFRGKTSYSKQRALKDINITIKKGEFFGIVGRNGSGKSTLLKIIAGIYQPTAGRVDVYGKLVPFIELGVGFNPELTGKENVFLNGAILGFSRKKIQTNYKKIVEFSELEDFMDQKLKNYSSGMQVRLAFACATMAEADILLVDEVLAVGDTDFQRKCFDYFKTLKKNKKTVVFVSHDMTAIREYCDRAILIEKNEMVLEGKTSKVASAYSQLFIDDKNKDTSKESKNGTSRWGDKSVVYTKIGLSKKHYSDTDEYIELDLEAVVNNADDNPNFGFSIKNASGYQILGTNTEIKKAKVTKTLVNDTLFINWKVPNVFADGQYYVDLAIVKKSGTVYCDWWEDATKFQVSRIERTPYVISPNIDLKISCNRKNR